MAPQLFSDLGKRAEKLFELPVKVAVYALICRYRFSSTVPRSHGACCCCYNLQPTRNQQHFRLSHHINRHLHFLLCRLGFSRRPPGMQSRSKMVRPPSLPPFVLSFRPPVDQRSNDAFLACPPPCRSACLSLCLSISLLLRPPACLSVSLPVPRAYLPVLLHASPFPSKAESRTVKMECISFSKQMNTNSDPRVPSFVRPQHPHTSRIIITTNTIC
jgi:hypothetical protein